MKYHDLSAFQKEITSSLPLLCLILTKEIDEQKHLVKAALKSCTLPLKTFDALTFSSKAFHQEVETLPFFDERKLLSIHGIDQLYSDDFKVIQPYVEKPNSCVSLFLTASSLSLQSRFVKLIEKKGVLFHSSNEKPWELEKRLADWLVSEALEAGVRLAQSTAAVLVKTGSNRASLKNELDKLICYVGKRQEITLNDVQKVITQIPQETLWQLGDAIFWCKKTHALKIGRMLVEEGMVLFPLIANLRSQMQTGIHILTALSEGGEGEVVMAYLNT